MAALFQPLSDRIAGRSSFRKKDRGSRGQGIVIQSTVSYTAVLQQRYSVAAALHDDKYHLSYIRYAVQPPIQQYEVLSIVPRTAAVSIVIYIWPMPPLWPYRYCCTSHPNERDLIWTTIRLNFRH